jgi:hypothetical protein
VVAQPVLNLRALLLIWTASLQTWEHFKPASNVNLDSKFAKTRTLYTWQHYFKFGQNICTKFKCLDSKYALLEIWTASMIANMPISAYTIKGELLLISWSKVD